MGEKVLKESADTAAIEGATCSYCAKAARTISIGDLAGRIEEAIERHFYRTSNEPEGIEYLAAKEGLWERPGERVVDVIADIAEIDEDPSRDVLLILQEKNPDSIDCSNEPPFDDEAQYAEVPPDDVDLQAEWDDFERTLKTENRFFSKDAQATLESIFRDLSTLRTRSGLTAVVPAGPGTGYQQLFRARTFQREQIGRWVLRPLPRRRLDG
jgi:hypothetical protein